jgi:hypothetical protein
VAFPISYYVRFVKRRLAFYVDVAPIYAKILKSRAKLAYFKVLRGFAR